MTVQKARREFESEYVKIFQNARKFMAESGNSQQWADKDFAAEVDADLNREVLYEIRNGNGTLLGVFAMLPSPDSTYAHIDGKWLTDGPYVVLHRVASSFAENRFLEKAIDFASTVSKTIRIDTHKDNLPMQKAIRRCGFTYCGIIYLENGEPRLAYERTQP